ncbi:glycosyltransferase family 4 protein [Kushneria indalinina]|uniref:Glycosyltransferase involved in cell wall biosynthesis n=1 Tax=Kushneria indalinina DSM 14324 TaxID=1122140 RepID=A0A3D9DTL9_9GAMM|nr:glycosyltransferase family 4 protein [Kushneria indalinina]REC93764.1 glycosyltransferase involved in cell wall biosynthesis [Kushneria indalinina DSM 14324]
MHICHVNLARNFRGGERQTQLLIEQLAAHDINQTLVCRRDSPLRHALSDIEGLELVSAHQMWAGHKLTPAVDLVHAHEARAVHWAWWHSKLRRTPYLLTRRVPQPVKDKWFNRRTYGGAATAVAISSPIEAHLEARHWCPVTRIPSALSHFTRNTTVVETLRHRFEGRYVIGHVGALVDRHKGQSLIIEAARRLADTHPDIVFLMLGSGEDEERFKQESDGLDNVIWEGFQSNVGDYLAAMDLFVFPSRNEGLGSTLLDAMDAEVPIIASNVDGIPDIVVDEESGVLIPPNDANALHDSILALREDPDRGARLARGACQRLEAFTPEAMASRYRTLYAQLLEADTA